MNVSEGRRAEVLDALAAAAGEGLLDIHHDPDHNRAVLTLVGEETPRRVAAEAVGRIELGSHAGVHPRLGVVDVVPFVALGETPASEAIAARNGFARWAGDELGLPCFLYGPERSLPDLRRQAFRSLQPDLGPAAPHPTAGASAVGARPVLVAYNLWLDGVPLDQARAIARDLRGPAVRALGLAVAGTSQVSLNLVEPATVGPAQAYDAVAARAPVLRAELVGLLPRAVLDAIDPHRWAELDLSPDRTIEARLTWRPGNRR